MKYQKKSHRSAASFPALSEQLAEFCGIMLGDGGISKYQIHVTLHRNEASEYGKYVSGLIEDLFKVRPAVYFRKESEGIDITLSRIAVVEFLTQQCGLVQGSKTAQAAGIPSWILANQRYRLACMRGLFDTDGSVFNHIYISKGKTYRYKKLGFTNVSNPILYSAHEILSSEGINNRFGSRHDLRIESSISVRKYFERFGSNNPKHLMRYGT